MYDKFLPLSFNDLLLDYYKELNITNDELVVLLMSDILLKDNNKIITNDLLALKLNMSFQEIDIALNSLMIKKYINLEIKENDYSTNLDNIKKILLDFYKRDLLLNDSRKENKENTLLVEGIINTFEAYFDRRLSETEKEYINKWIDAGIEEELIINSLKDALTLNQLSFKKIDNIIAAKLKEDEF